MKVGPYAGRKVSEVKPIIKEELIASEQALLYSEPEKQVCVCLCVCVFDLCLTFA
jgi:leucyl-tRNA synthetase